MIYGVGLHEAKREYRKDMKGVILKVVPSRGFILSEETT